MREQQIFDRAAVRRAFNGLEGESQELQLLLLLTGVCREIPGMESCSLGGVQDVCMYVCR